MNILIPHSWLKEYVKTSLKPTEIAERVSLSGVSVEKVEKFPLSDDFIYEIEITSNRPDMLSVIGIAREVAAILGSPFSGPEITRKRPVDPSGQLSIKILDPKACPRYLGVLLDSVEVGPSPALISERLIKSGLRPINNVVDITNYVMLEYGQPLHAFDADLLAPSGDGFPEIIVRPARDGERFTTLDNQKFKLKKSMLVIADGKDPVAIAGIKGGEKAEVSSETKKIILECANFNPISVRSTSRELNLMTDASVRFEKGLAPLGLEAPFNRVIDLLIKHAGAEAASPIVDAFPGKVKSKKVAFDYSSVKRVLGKNIPKKESKRILESLGFKLKRDNKDFIVSVPDWRYSDVEREECIVEEIGRVYGYHNLEGRLLDTRIPADLRPKNFYWEDKARDILNSLGLSEVYTYSFVSKDLLKRFSMDPGKHLIVDNPLSGEFVYMRKSLIPGIMEVAGRNKKKFEEIKIFELSRVYIKSRKELPEEQMRISGAVLKRKASPGLFYEVKGMLEYLLRSLGINEFSFHSAKSPLFSPEVSSSLKINGKRVGVFGFLRNEISGRIKVKDKACIFDLNFDDLLKYVSSLKSYSPLPKYPSVEFDVSLIISEDALWRDVKKKVREKGGSLVKKVELFDVYQGGNIGSNNKSLAFRVTYRSDKKSLKEEEVKDQHAKVITGLKTELKAKVRE